MVVGSNTQGASRALVESEAFTLWADTTPPKGQGEGFRPHELLEAALASCMAISVRFAAEERSLSLEDVRVSVQIDRTEEDKTTFRTQVELVGPLSDQDRRLLLAAARRCPVRKTLSKTIAFDELQP
jgi:putative redox protein